MNIAVVCYMDAGNTGRHLYMAISRGGRHKVCYADQRKGRYNYIACISNADIIWVKGDTIAEISKGRFNLYNQKATQIIQKASNIPVKPGARLIQSPGGSSFRRPIPGYVKSFGYVPLERFINNSSLLAPITPDLNYPQLEGVWLPHAIDEKKMSNMWNPGKEFIIGAYLAQNDCKCVNTVLVPAVERLRRKGYKIDLRITNGVSIPHNEFMKIISECTIYYDQINPLGVYGRSGVEAMSMGIPTICSISEKSIKQAEPVQGYGDPCLKAHDIKGLEAMLELVYLGKIDLRKVSEESKKYARRVHSYESVAKYIDAQVMGRIK